MEDKTKRNGQNYYSETSQTRLCPLSDAVQWVLWNDINQVLKGQCEVRFGGQIINNFRYVDDTALLADIIEEL